MVKLAGWRVVVTRAEAQAADLVAALAAEGAEPVELPTIDVVPPADGGTALAHAAVGLGSYDWVVLTSVNGVEHLSSSLPVGTGLAGALAGVKVAAIGPGTATALSREGVTPDLVPQRFVAEGLLAVFPAPDPRSEPRAGRRRSARVLLPRAAAARDVLPEGLRERGYEVDVVEAYRTVVPPAAPAAIEAARTADAITFSAPSTVRGYVQLAGAAHVPPVVACIGPVTAAAAGEAGIAVDVVAAEHTIRGLVAALISVASDRTRARERPPAAPPPAAPPPATPPSPLL